MALSREAQNPEQTPIEREEGPAAENPEQTPIGERSPVAENAGRTSVEGGLSAENPEQTPISYLLGVCSGFSRLRYRRRGARGPAGTLLYDPARIEPRRWLAERLGEVVVLDADDAVEPRQVDQRQAPAAAGFVSPGRREDAQRMPPHLQPATGVDSRGLRSPGAAAGANEAPDVARLAEPADESGAADPAAAYDDFDEERAAIIEFDGRIPRPWAEAFARLDPERPPDGVAGQQWRQYVDDIGGFLDSPLLTVADGMGWRPRDLFGKQADRATFDQGLLWLRRKSAESENALRREQPS